MEYGIDVVLVEQIHEMVLEGRTMHRGEHGDCISLRRRPVFHTTEIHQEARRHLLVNLEGIHQLRVDD